jgi:hypothetical protein
MVEGILNCSGDRFGANICTIIFSEFSYSNSLLNTIFQPWIVSLNIVCCSALGP